MATSRKDVDQPEDHIESLLNDGKFSDCTIIAADGVEIKAHLAYICRSKYFNNAFTQQGFIEGREKTMSLPENSTILRVLIRGIYLSLERSTTLLKQYEALVNAMSPADMFLLASTAHKYRLPTIQSVVQHNFILKMSNAQHHLTGGLPSQPEHSPFLEALRTMYSEEDTFREELRKKLCAVANPASLLNCNNGLKKSVMTACPAYFTEMVAKWKASTTQENYGARCIHCEQTWKWTDFAGNDRQLCCPSCSARATWMTFLAYWLVANGLPRK